MTANAVPLTLQGFHVSRPARETYSFDEELFTPLGNLTVPNFRTARLIAQQINAERNLATHPEQAVYAGQVYAVSLIHEVQRFLFRRYLSQQSNQLLREALTWAEAQFGSDPTEATLDVYTDEFPPLSVYNDELTRAQFLAGRTANVPNREVVLEEMVVLWLANENPAFDRFVELFDAAPLAQQTIYPDLLTGLYQLFGQAGHLSETGENILD